MIRSALRRLQLARVNVLGSVITKFHAKAVGYAYAYSYKYSYSYAYGEDAYANSKSGSSGQGQPRLAKTAMS
jgi:hypothetical protein